MKDVKMDKTMEKLTELAEAAGLECRLPDEALDNVNGGSPDSWKGSGYNLSGEASYNTGNVAVDTSGWNRFWCGGRRFYYKGAELTDDEATKVVFANINKANGTNWNSVKDALAYHQEHLNEYNDWKASY